MNEVKTIILSCLGIIGGFFASIFGGWNSALTTLVIFMAIDYFSGLAVALVFKKSPKTENGALESRAGFKGLCKKGMMLLVVLVACRLDLALGMSIVKDASIIAFVTNETISIIENAGLMGVPIPSVVKNTIEVLNTKKVTDIPYTMEKNDNENN